MPKIGTNWNTLEPGDIVSFRYQSVVDKTKQPRTTTILVLNNKYQKKLKSGKTEFYINAEFRSYNWEQARKNSVYYEPIKLPKDKILLMESQRAENEN